jgi:hypothetical protein
MLKNRDNIIKLIVLAILLVGAAFCINNLSGNEDFYKTALNERENRSYSGIVMEKYIDSAEHGTPMLKFASSNVTALETNFWDKVEIGDSIVKIKGQAIITLYKGGKLKEVFNYNEYFDKLIQRSKK